MKNLIDHPIHREFLQLDLPEPPPRWEHPGSIPATSDMPAVWAHVTDDGATHRWVATIRDRTHTGGAGACPDCAPGTHTIPAWEWARREGRLPPLIELVGEPGVDPDPELTRFLQTLHHPD